MPCPKRNPFSIQGPILTSEQMKLVINHGHYLMTYLQSVKLYGQFDQGEQHRHIMRGERQMHRVQ